MTSKLPPTELEPPRNRNKKKEKKAFDEKKKKRDLDRGMLSSKNM